MKRKICSLVLILAIFLLPLLRAGEDDKAPEEKSIWEQLQEQVRKDIENGLSGKGVFNNAINFLADKDRCMGLAKEMAEGKTSKDEVKGFLLALNPEFRENLGYEAWVASEASYWKIQWEGIKSIPGALGEGGLYGLCSLGDGLLNTFAPTPFQPHEGCRDWFAENVGFESIYTTMSASAASIGRTLWGSGPDLNAGAEKAVKAACGVAGEVFEDYAPH